MAWTKNRNGFIDSALQMAGIVTVGNNSPIHWINKATEQLQAILEDLHNESVLLEVEWDTKALTASSEVTGTDALIYTAIRSHSATADNRPITGANWQSYWIQTGTTGGTWTLGTSYTAIGDFDVDSDTVEVSLAFLRKTNNDDRPLLVHLSADEYLAVPDKTTTGEPLSMYVDYKTASGTPHVYLNYQPDLTTYIFNYLKVKKIDSCDSSTSVPDLYKNCWDYLQYRLAYKMTFFGGGKGEGDKNRLEREAELLLRKIKKEELHKIRQSVESCGSY